MPECGFTESAEIARLSVAPDSDALHSLSVSVRVVLLALVVAGVGSCGKSRDELEQEKVARQAAMEKALAASLAEEREKDRRMLEAASAQANERLARDAAEHAQELARMAPARLQPPQEQKDAERAELLRRFTDKLRQSTADPVSMQLRWGELSPKSNAMCAEFSAKTKAGAYTAWKRAVVTDLRVAVEEPPTRETMNQFLLFQIAARDTGCFPDVQAVKILQ